MNLDDDKRSRLLSIHCLLRVCIHAVVASVIGYVVLHPVSMLIYRYSEQSSNLPMWQVLTHAFLPTHFNMAVYFAFVGGGFGIIYGLFACKTAMLYEKMKILSITDELTSLYNRRYFMDCLIMETALAEEHTYCLSLIMIDVDHFKRYNDTYGHQQGDALLQGLAECLQHGTRAGDVVARYGGEEFVVVMRDTDKATALQQAQRTCCAIGEQPFFDHGGASLGHVTISLGVAEFPTDAGLVDELIKKADAELYRAKAEGRNRACAHGF